MKHKHTDRERLKRLRLFQKSGFTTTFSVLKLLLVLWMFPQKGQILY